MDYWLKAEQVCSIATPRQQHIHRAVYDVHSTSSQDNDCGRKADGEINIQSSPSARLSLSSSH